MDELLNIKGLCKSFGHKSVVKDFSLEVKAGEIVGLVGPNGAGKTTIMKMLIGLLKPSSGTACICEKNVQSDFEKAIANVGAIIEVPEFYRHMTGYQNLMQYARIYGVSKERTIETLKIVGLEKKMNDKVKKYSLGMRQRLGIAQAILHKPKLLILDEPTNGLDTAAVLELRIYLKKIVEEQNCGILISSHMLSEIEKLCSKVAIISNGVLLDVRKVEECEDEKQSSLETIFMNVTGGNNDERIG